MLIKLILFIWQAPQKLLGFILIKLTNAEYRHIKTETGKCIYYWYYVRDTKFKQFISGVSLANIILISTDNETTIKHEHGHSIQSLYMGWLYLPVIGIYSALFCNMWQRWFHKDWNRYDRHYWYYITRWCEKWADKLGKVDRKAILRQIPRFENSRFPAV
jgi:hypothetical protein